MKRDGGGGVCLGGFAMKRDGMLHYIETRFSFSSITIKKKKIIIL